MPTGAKYVGRPTKWGNPFKITDIDNGEKVLCLYEAWLKNQIAQGKLDVSVLKGLDLACFCPLSSPCHADVLLRMANQ